MKKTVYLLHKNGRTRTIQLGFCWVGFFIPMLWSISEGLWRPFAFTLFCALVLRISGDAAKHYGNEGFIVAGLITYLLTMICFGLYGKRWLVSDLIRHGYADNSSLHTDAQARQ